MTNYGVQANNIEQTNHTNKQEPINDDNKCEQKVYTLSASML